MLKDFLAEKLPRLASHFEDHSIDVSLITFNWFLVVFVESLPSDILLPLWDAFLYEGTKVSRHADRKECLPPLSLPADCSNDISKHVASVKHEDCKSSSSADPTVNIL